VSDLRVREGTAADAAAVLALNNASVPHVNALDAETLVQLVAMHAVYLVAEDADGILGFVLCIASGGRYWSENYRWFAARYDAFCYLDRVVVHPRAQRRGVGRALYAAVERQCAGRWPRIALEVNLRPPNPGSVAFHAALGYVAVGEREYADGANAVQMYLKALA
jgi:predicted GNAT superfamily acetyltransferase